MKKYYLHDGKAQQGPYDLNDLKIIEISTETHVWFEGLQNWTPAGQIGEMKELFEGAPPPFKPETPQQFNPDLPRQYGYFETGSALKKKPLILSAAIATLAIIIAIFYFTNNTSEAATSTRPEFTSSVIEDTAKATTEKSQEIEPVIESNDNIISKNLEYRNNWRRYIEHKASKYKVHSIGGISDLKINVMNKTERIVDEVVVTVYYYKEKGGLITTKDVSITNIRPNSYGSVKVPNTSRGKRIDTKISKITARSIYFCYDLEMDGSRSGRSDPWFCK